VIKKVGKFSLDLESHMVSPDTLEVSINSGGARQLAIMIVDNPEGEFVEVIASNTHMIQDEPIASIEIQYDDIRYPSGAAMV